MMIFQGRLWAYTCAGLIVASMLAALFSYPAAETRSILQQPRLDSGNHLLGTGDHLLVQFFDGRHQEEYNAQVDAEGKITLPIAGSIKVSGMTATKAAEQVTFYYAEYYLNPRATIQVLRYGKLEVFVFGPDHAGKIIQLDNGSRFSRLLEVIEYPDYGQYRQLHLLRGGIDFQNLSAPKIAAIGSGSNDANILSTPSPPALSRKNKSLTSYQNWRPWIEQRKKNPETKIWVIDPLQVLLEGDLSQYNIVLQDRDVVFIPTAESFVVIHGVSRPGTYELIANEDLGEILRLAGTLNYNGDLANAVIQRYDDWGTMQRIIVNLYPALEDLSATECIKLQNRDVIRIMNRELRIFVLGMVNEAGAFNFIEDSTVLDYLALAKGETADAHLAWIAIIRQSRNRQLVGDAAEVIRVNFKEIHKGFPSCVDIALLPGDVIYVPPKGKGFEVTEIIQAAGTVITGIAISDSLNGSSDSK